VCISDGAAAPVLVTFQTVNSADQHDDRLIEVALDDWMGDVAGTLARPEEFLDLPHDPACVRFHENRRGVRTASAAQVREPINARGLGRWHRYADDLAPMIAELETGGAPPRSAAGGA
jgi:hypothetical protein